MGVDGWLRAYGGFVSDLDGPSREELLAALAERDQMIAVLRAEIEMLKRRAGMDSSNSSMPPGVDGPAARARRAKQRKAKPSPRKRGGQAGHEGRGLERVADPDRVQVLTPTGCGGCGSDLSGVAGRIASRIQVFDTPPVKLEVTEYQLTAVTCPDCQVVTRASAPDGVAGPCCYGPNVRAATALLACNGHMSVERAADLMGVLLDAPVSTGFTGGLVKRLAGRLAGFETALKHALRAAPVMHHDETPARVASDDHDRPAVEDQPRSCPPEPNGRVRTAPSPYPPDLSRSTLERRKRRFLAYSFPSRSLDPLHLAVLARPGFVRAACRPPRHHPDRAALSFPALPRQDGRRRSCTLVRTINASRRTSLPRNTSPPGAECRAPAPTPAPGP